MKKSLYDLAIEKGAAALVSVYPDPVAAVNARAAAHDDPWYHDKPRYCALPYYYMVHSVSRSGMSRTISLWIDNPAGGSVKIADRVKIGGCGMDMVFALMDHICHEAYTRAGYSWPDGSHGWQSYFRQAAM